MSYTRRKPIFLPSRNTDRLAGIEQRINAHVVSSQSQWTTHEMNEIIGALGWGS